MNKNILLLISILMSFLITPQQTGAQVMSDYTAYPPFVAAGGMDPNILLVLDHSGSMQFPAYIGCDFTTYDNKRAKCGSSDSIQDPEYVYEVTHDYYGYFKIDKYYEYDTNKFVENDACVFADTDAEYRIGDTSGCISGNLLNWATMSRIDLLRKVLIGGKSVSTQTNAHTLRAEGGWREFSDHNLGCTFTLDGGSYPNLDHDLTITDYGLTGTCGYLTMWSSGSQIWDTSDSFRYIYQPVSGDFDVQLRVVSAPTESGQTYAKSGLMVRGSTAANSQHVSVNATYGAGLQFSYRAVDGGTTSTYADYKSRNYPEWVRLVRIGNVFTAYYSDNGSSWTMRNSVTVAMPADVLVGMSAASYSSSTLASAEFDEFICDVCSSDNFDDYVFDTGIWTAIDIDTSIEGTQIESCGGTCLVGTLSGANLKVDVPEADRRGVVQTLSDKDYDTQWDDDTPRFGVMIYAGDNREGEMRVGIDGSNMSSFLTSLQNEPPYSGTPTGEALREAYDYFTQTNSWTYEDNNAYIGGPGSSKDPMYVDGTVSACRKNFVLLISDGEWNGSVDPVVPARVNFVNDIRADIDGTQSISTYSVFTFGDEGSGRNALQQTALYGDFDDYDENTWPYNRTAYPSDSRNATLPASPCNPASLPMNGACKEWDKDEDGLPDNYYEASDGNKLENALITAITDILKNASSGTAVSVLATTGEGEGAVYQAYFYPHKLEDLQSRDWLGYIHALFVDEYGNLREDTNNNNALDMMSDLILIMEYTEENGTIINKYNDVDGKGTIGSLVETVPLDDVSSIWNGGINLWSMDPVNRTIFTTTDGYTHVDFTTANAVALESDLRAADSTESENIINWIRGYDFTDDETGVDFLPDTTDTGHPDGYRQRSITPSGETDVHVWKLGDIVYSTPTVVGRPMENYDILYGDSTYYTFRDNNLDRRLVVYAGANDGMLHAFNGGFYAEDSHQYCANGIDETGACAPGSRALGDELWSFIPRGLLPHLKWLTDPYYTHVYYVDLKPKVTDVRIFDNATHSGGWGTILIGGFRYGGKDISWATGSAQPEYYAIDITDPLDPKLLWTFTDDDLGLSMSYPSIARIGAKESDDPGEWYVIFGSGPTNFDSDSNLTAFSDGYVFVLNISSGNDGEIFPWTEGTNYWKLPTNNTTAFLADSITVDVDIDYDVDVIYIGENYEENGGSWNALMRRYSTARGSISDPLLWSPTVILDVGTVAGANDPSKKITAAPSASMDNKGELWLFFGTGQFLGSNDKNPDDTGAFYAVKDQCWTTICTNVSGTKFLDISGASVKKSTSGIEVSGAGGDCAVSGSDWTSLLSAVDDDACHGWVMYFNSVTESVDFNGTSLVHDGERVTSKPLIIGGLASWASYIPGDNECDILGESNAYSVYYKTGTAYKGYVFEGQIDTANPTGGEGGTIVARTKYLDKGMPSTPSAQITSDGGVSIIHQPSSGAVLPIKMEAPARLTSEVSGWKTTCVE